MGMESILYTVAEGKWSSGPLSKTRIMELTLARGENLTGNTNASNGWTRGKLQVSTSVGFLTVRAL